VGVNAKESLNLFPAGFACACKPLIVIFRLAWDPQKPKNIKRQKYKKKDHPHPPEKMGIHPGKKMHIWELSFFENNVWPFFSGPFLFQILF